MKYKLVADIHIGSKYEIEEEVVREVLGLPASKETILLGDIVDRTCCHKKDLVNVVKIQAHLMRLHRDNYTDGNHEANLPKAVGLTMNGILFTHGDDEANPTKWRKYRADHKLGGGAGLFKRIAIMPFISLFNELVGGKPKEDFYKRAAFRAKANNCHTYVCGHFHPKKLIDIKYDGIRIIVVPQGITELEL